MELVNGIARVSESTGVAYRVSEHGCRVNLFFLRPLEHYRVSVWQLRVMGKVVSRRCRGKNLDTPPKTPLKKFRGEKHGTREKKKFGGHYSKNPTPLNRPIRARSRAAAAASQNPGPSQKIRCSASFLARSWACGCRLHSKCSKWMVGLEQARTLGVVKGQGPSVLPRFSLDVTGSQHECIITTIALWPTRVYTRPPRRPLPLPNCGT